MAAIPPWRSGNRRVPGSSRRLDSGPVGEVGRLGLHHVRLRPAGAREDLARGQQVERWLEIARCARDGLPRVRAKVDLDRGSAAPRSRQDPPVGRVSTCRVPPSLRHVGDLRPSVPSSSGASSAGRRRAPRPARTGGRRAETHARRRGSRRTSGWSSFRWPDPRRGTRADLRPRPFPTRAALAGVQHRGMHDEDRRVGQALPASPPRPQSDGPAFLACADGRLEADSRSSSSVSSTSSSADQRRHPFHHVHLDVAVDRKSPRPGRAPCPCPCQGCFGPRRARPGRRRGRGRPGPGCRGRGRPRRGQCKLSSWSWSCLLWSWPSSPWPWWSCLQPIGGDHRRHDRLRDERLGRAEAPRVDDLVADARALAVRVEVVPEAIEVEAKDVPADSLAGSPDDGRGVADEGAPVERVRLLSCPAGLWTVRLGAGGVQVTVPPGRRSPRRAKRGSPRESRIVTASVAAPSAASP